MSTFNPPADIAQITLARSSDVNDLKDATSIAFSLLPSETKLQRGTVNFAVDTGTANTYVVTLDPSITTYTDGLQVVFRPLNSNTSTSTINLNGLGAKSIVLTNSDPIQAGDISAGTIIDVRYSTATGFFHLTPNSAIYAHDAGVSATAAALSASAASASASAAATSASAASTSASAAATSASAASTSASAASTSASNASTSASSASASASNASASASNAAGSATTASTQASAAATSASSASTSASNASTSANNAASSASTATTQASAASTSATNSLNYLNLFKGQYYGSLASNPTLDPLGAAMSAGDLYWNSTVNEMRVYSGSAWVTAYVSASSTGASIRPSLLLDFANSKTLDPRITFTRASTATYTGYDGLIKTAASGAPRFDFNPTTGESLGLLIEEQRTNLLTYSEQFDNAIWAKSNATVTANATTAPDGTITADKFVENTLYNFHTLHQNVTGVANTAYTFSAYFKAAERFYIQVQVDNTTSSALFVNLNVSNGTIIGVAGNSGTASGATATITGVGNGWYKVTLSGIPFTSGTALRALLYLKDNSNNFSYTGDGTSGIYIWGAQLEAGAFPTSYIPSADSFTSRASSGSFIGSNGLIQSASTNTARYNYNPVNLALAPKLLLEPAATNLLTYSEQFDNAAWTKTNATVTANATTAPDGTVTADKFVESVDSTPQYHEIIQYVSGANTYTLSFFAKADSRSKICLDIFNTTDGSVNVYIDLSTGTISSTSSGATSSITPVGNGWYRCTLTKAITHTGATRFGIFTCDNSGSINYIGSGQSVYIWGAQLETGTTATSYIQTTSAQVTRAADVSTSAQATRAADNAVMTGTNFSSWYRQDEGTVFVKYKYENPTNSTGQYPCTININDGTTNNEIYQLTQSSSNFETFGVRSNNIVSADMYSSQAISTTSSNIVAGVYQLNSFAACLNGLSPQTDTSGNVPVSVTQMSIGSRIGNAWLNGHIAKLAYYPKRLTNAELQSITTV